MTEVGVCLLNWQRNQRRGMMLLRKVASLILTPGSICEVRRYPDKPEESEHDFREFHLTDAGDVLPHSFAPWLRQPEGYYLVERFRV